MKDKVVLYIATHNKTGLRYFGKTTKYLTETELQENYHGSGVYWNKHLKKHGDDVTMELFGVYSVIPDSHNYVKPIALKFSKDNNIVKSDKWANIVEEDGLEGGRYSGILAKEWSERAALTMTTTKLDNGLTIAQDRAIRAATTMKDTILENGKSIIENKAEKALETRKTVNKETGLTPNQVAGMKISKIKQSEAWKNTIGKQSKEKLSKTLRESGSQRGSKNGNAKIFHIYNEDGVIVFESHGNLRQLCENNNLPYDVLRRNKNKPIYTRKNQHKYKGWKLVEYTEGKI